MASTVATKQILLVDSHADSRVIYRAILEHAGYSVSEASTGDEAVHRARSEQPGAILLELVLERVDGLGVLGILKAEAATANIPMIVLTSYDEAESRQAATGAGSDGYLVKPCSPASILREVAFQLERGSRRGDPEPGASVAPSADHLRSAQGRRGPIAPVQRQG